MFSTEIKYISTKYRIEYVYSWILDLDLRVSNADDGPAPVPAPDGSAPVPATAWRTAPSSAQTLCGVVITAAMQPQANVQVRLA